MENPTLIIEKRERSGKGTSRKLRAKGLVPGVIYGREVAEPIKVAFDPKTLQKALEGEMRQNTVLNIEIAGEGKGAFMAMVQDYQFHPSKRTILHVDFITVSPDRDVEVEVPIRATGKAAGVQKGGLLMEICHDLPIRCLPGKIPVELVVDVSPLDIGQSIKVADLTLPEGIKATLPPEQALVSITTVKEEKEVAVVEEEAEAAEAVEGAEEKLEAEGEKKEKDKKEEEKKGEAKKGEAKKEGKKEGKK
jgi:large subunit ribosomal protein L25